MKPQLLSRALTDPRHGALAPRAADAVPFLLDDVSALTSLEPTGRHDIFRWMSLAARQSFEYTAKRRRYARGQMIFQEGDPCQEMYRLVSGHVRSFATRENGREFVYTQLQEGDCFGVAELIDSVARQDNVVAQTDIEVQVLSAQQFDTLKSVQPTFNNAVLKLLASQVMNLSRQVAGAHLDHYSIRLARILVQTASFTTDTRHTVQLAQVDLAFMLGTSRQTVNKLLKQFEEAGMVGLNYGSVIIRDFDRLEKHAQGC